MSTMSEEAFWSHFDSTIRRRTLYLPSRDSYETKVETLTHYGNGKLACVRCGFSDIRALSLDHINGKTPEEKRERKHKGGCPLYSYLRSLGYPTGYQTLCMNCQFIKKDENLEVNKTKI